MSRGPIFHRDYKPQFSGHETFPLRYGWLTKAFNAVNSCKNESCDKALFLDDAAIARFGLGKNMVAAMRHWAIATRILIDNKRHNFIAPTPLGHKIFGNGRLDPYLEFPASLWLLHWQISGHAEKTTWYWSFNNFPEIFFERTRLVNGLEKVARDCEWKPIATTTIKRDVECFVRTYVARRTSPRSSHEDTLESPLAELGLIRPIGKKDGFRFVRGPKSTLGRGVFIYALIDFWRAYSDARTLSFEAIAHEPGSPGRVFLLDENDIAHRLLDLEDFSKGRFRWSETAGLKQVIREDDLDLNRALDFINADYGRLNGKEAAK